MSEVAFRFLHASDFHLEQPVTGLSDIPEALREVCIDAPYIAAERVFDLALAERVDFVLLSGDLLDPRAAGPRALAFLQEQFDRLNAQGIAVYWAGGSVDKPDSWPEAIRLPTGIEIFPRGRVEELTHMRVDQPIAAILGTSNANFEIFPEHEFRGDSQDLFRIGVAYGRVNIAGAARPDVDYWALGGKHEQEPLGENTRWGNYCGSPQGRDPVETGAHGCLLVHVNAERKVRAQLHPTDEVRFLVEHVEVERDITRVELEKLLIERAQGLTANNGERRLIVEWRIHGAQRIAMAHRTKQLADSILESLHDKFHRGQSHVWSRSLEFEDAALPADWYEEDSILGDYLRGLREALTEDADVNRLLETAAAHPQGLPQVEATDWLPRWERMLLDASVLGAQLLRPEADISAPLGDSRRASATAREMPT
jgi:DNA repair exonuclease SbcCD nuclease subunit